MKPMLSIVGAALGIFVISPSGHASGKWSGNRCNYYNQLGTDVATCRNNVPKVMDEHYRQNRNAVYQMYSKSPEELCASNSKAEGIDNGRCKNAVNELQNYINQRKQRRADRCDEMVDHAKACQACASNLASVDCNKQDLTINKKWKGGQGKWKKAQRDLAEKIKNVEDAMLDLSSAYAQNIKNNEFDMEKGVKNSQAAAAIGASTPQQALQMHGNVDASTISGFIQQIQSAKDINEDQINQIGSLQDKYAAESLKLAATAKSARVDIEKDVAQEDARDAAVAQNSQFVDTTNEKMASLNNQDSGIFGSSNTPAAAQGVASALGGAGSAASGGGGSTQVASSEAAGSPSGYDSYGTLHPQSSGQGAIPLNPLTANAGSGTNAVASEQVAALTGDQAEDAAGVNSSGASVAGGSLRDALRAKMAEQAAGGTGAVGASTALGAKSAGEGGKAGAKALGPEKTALLTGFQPTDYSGGEEAFDMAESETDAAVQEMISEFQGEAQIPGVHRGLASSDLQQLAPEILSEDSSSLFLRTSEFYTRCLKRGCVAR
jgi:hypothetical protein